MCVWMRFMLVECHLDKNKVIEIRIRAELYMYNGEFEELSPSKCIVK